MHRARVAKLPSWLNNSRLLMPIVKRKLWLCVAPAMVCAFDAAITLWFQPDAYWAGQFEKVREFSPPDRWMLMQHPLAFVAWVLFWISAFCTVLVLLPTRLGLIVSLTLILGNATGASSWLYQQLPHGFWFGMGLFALVAALVVVTWWRAGVLKTAG